MFAFLPRVTPAPLAMLTDLALNLRWTWNHELDTLWRTIDAELWERTHNPWAVLQNVSQDRLDELSRDSAFLDELARVLESHRRYHDEPGWCRACVGEGEPATIAYFSMEFGLSEAFPLYAGGLGVLAGDYLKTASDLDAPIVGVGLLYQEGYFRQTIDAGGQQREAYPYNDPNSLPIQPVIGSDGAWVKVGLRLPGRKVYLRVWQAIVGRTHLYLLDSNDVRNGPGDRGITAKLYGGGSEMRLLQEVILGVGGWAMLGALGLKVDVCHLNEGHAALLVLARARSFMRRMGTSFWEAWWATRAGNVFTTHTPVAAGFDAFAPALVCKYAHEYLQDVGVSQRDFLGLGRLDPFDDHEPFKLAYLALRGCAQVNGVSRLHGKVSRRLFADLYPRWPIDEVPVRHVTNGVHVPSWDSAWSDRLWTEACGKQRWLGAVDALPAAVAVNDDRKLWELAAAQRRDLVQYTRQRLMWHLGQRGESAQVVAVAAQVLDPNILTLGMARRFTAYKRPNLLLSDPERLARLLCCDQRPAQLIIAGKAHPEDEEGKRLIKAWFEFSHLPQLRRRVVLLEDYDIALAQQLVQGVDVWINTPRRPWEACGTSGMKVLANGGLNLSELDGWWAEAYEPAFGWAIGEGGPSDDAADAERLYRLLEDEVLPLFYARDAQGIPREWVKRKRASMANLAPRFSSNRMLAEYLEQFYLPAIRAVRRREDNQAKLARELCAWQAALAAQWHEVHFGSVEVKRQGDQWRFDVPVYLGEIMPDGVKVELYAMPYGELPAQAIPMQSLGPITGALQGYIFSAHIPAERPAEHYTPRVRAWHADAFLPAEASQIAWQR
ncbi:alpha-glucan phosphorylase [Pandoraea thiooxydans]|uniref:Alpha-glucan phosphorylase n=1 Tax=Pandoraea thiooxydans TaxID=445709 RepID=A0A0G3ET10_9BURK|nr:alpha-glucan family phosphorylase [Pandoraea thiooxydans]AKJ68442.1 alpha-glucan phosphorylase [Pandoraea thiooxydans]APR95813.1 alpha-glucan phosphorylase [Pandoraea thiooxydans]